MFKSWLCCTGFVHQILAHGSCQSCAHWIVWMSHVFRPEAGIFQMPPGIEFNLLAVLSCLAPRSGLDMFWCHVQHSTHCFCLRLPPYSSGCSVAPAQKKCVCVLRHIIIFLPPGSTGLWPRNSFEQILSENPCLKNPLWKIQLWKLLFWKFLVLISLLEIASFENSYFEKKSDLKQNSCQQKSLQLDPQKNICITP